MVKLTTYLSTIGVLHKYRLYFPCVITKSFPLKLTKQNRNVYKELVTRRKLQICLFGQDALV